MDFEALFQYFKEWASDLYQNFVNLFKSHEELRQENFMLRAQLALYDHDVKTGKRPKPKATPAFRQKMVLLSNSFAQWKECLATHIPRTVIRWHETAFKSHWFKKSKKKAARRFPRRPLTLLKNYINKTITFPRKKYMRKAPWQNPYAERVIGTLRRELLDHVIPVNEKHLHYLLSEYIHKYYNPHRTHQGLGGQTPIPSPEYPLTTMAETKLKATPVLGGLYHTYEKVA